MDSLDAISRAYHAWNAMAPVREREIPLAVDVIDSINFENLDPGQVAIVTEEYAAEHLDMDAQLSSICFTCISIDVLPPSIFEDTSFMPPDMEPCKAAKILQENLQRIQDIEVSIENDGYDASHPILLFAVPSRMDGGKTCMARLEGGMHRIQATRNLVARNMLVPSFAIPCLVRFHFVEHLVASASRGKGLVFPL